MNDITNIIVKPYRSNSIIVINNNDDSGGNIEDTTNQYTVKLAKYSQNGVLSNYITLFTDMLSIDSVTYTSGGAQINGIYNPYSTTATLPIIELKGKEIVPDSDGVYSLHIFKTDTPATQEMYNVTVINGILQCRKEFYDRILRESNCDTTCLTCNNPKKDIANYIEFNNLWQTIQNYSEYLSFFRPVSTQLYIPTSIDIRNVYSLIERAKNYCIFCDNSCNTCN